jgi:hypothetical protein
LLGELKNLFPAEHSVKEFHLNTPSLTEAEIEEMRNYQVWVFAFPLYVDALPSHFLSCLCHIEKVGVGKNIHVYAIVNSGFCEGMQNRNALAVMENWCRRTDLTWGMGIGFGGGGAMTGMKNIPLGKGPKAGLGKAYAVLSDAVLRRTSKENIYTSIGFPRFLYKLVAEIGWWRLIRANGGRWKDLDIKLHG